MKSSVKQKKHVPDDFEVWRKYSVKEAKAFRKAVKSSATKVRKYIKANWGPTRSSVMEMRENAVAWFKGQKSPKNTHKDL